MDKVHKPSNSECYTPLLESFRLYRTVILHVVLFGYEVWIQTLRGRH
jgi:hypothetical protein